jgi:hypothetical protein
MFKAQLAGVSSSHEPLRVAHATSPKEAFIQPRAGSGTSIKVFDRVGNHAVTVNLFAHESGSVTVDVIKADFDSKLPAWLRRTIKVLSWDKGTPVLDHELPNMCAVVVSAKPSRLD